MGTNYYLNRQESTCKCCGQSLPDTSLHIGKSSAGWHFSLRVHPDHNIGTLSDWMDRFAKDGYVIKDEYGETVSPFEMLKTITCRSWTSPSDSDAQSEYMRRRFNSAEVGLNGLLRAKIDGNHCVGHGEGTWDYIQGEFS